MLIGQRVREFMNHQHRLRGRVAGFHQEKFFAPVVVKGRGLFGEQVNCTFHQLVIGGHESEAFQYKLLDADLIRLHFLLNALFQILSELLFSDRVVLYFLQGA
ncbi:MAG: hypothetical protein WKF37_14850 [Bryobacteraceae bacterium]